MMERKALAIFVLCVIFWVSHVIPLMITSLLAIILFPLMGVLPADKTYSLFGNQAVFFILGAFILASSVTRTGLSNRMALIFLKWFGHSPKILLLGVIALSAFFSFWMSEHAVAAMMFPIVVAISASLELKPTESNYGKALFFGMAWGCVIGGVATFLGGARAPLAVGILRDTTGESIGFIKWALAALPTVIAMLVVTYLLLIFLFPAEIKDVKRAQILLINRTACIGRMKRDEWAIGILMVITIFSWICFGERFGLANIALAAVVIAFVFKLLRWKEVEEDVNWGLILMYGGAICPWLCYGKDRRNPLVGRYNRFRINPITICFNYDDITCCNLFDRGNKQYGSSCTLDADNDRTCNRFFNRSRNYYISRSCSIRVGLYSAHGHSGSCHCVLIWFH